MDILFDPNRNRMTNMQICRLYIDEFIRSQERKWMHDGAAYYVVDNPVIMNRKMYRYRENEATGQIERIPDNAKPNNRRAHGFMHILVEDKVNYLLSKPFTLSCEGAEEHLKLVKDVLGKWFQEKRLMRLGVDASNGGIAWLHPYIDESGKFQTMIVKPEQGIPLWKDNDHEEMDGFIWFYDVDTIEGQEQKTITRVEYWMPDCVAYYVSDSSGEGLDLRLDSERYLSAAEGEGEFMEQFLIGKEPGSWGKVPFIAFRNNDYELPDLKFVKTLIDGYDKARSDIANFLDDVQSIVYALKGYGGHDLGEFMRDLNYFRAISLDEDGGAEAITAPIDIAAAKDDFEALKKDIYDFGQGVDKNSDRLGNSPSGIALKFIYSGLDLKCNRMENAFKVGMEQVFWFVNRYLELIGSGTNQQNLEIDITFNRDIAINESQAITDCQNSQGIVSDETIIKNHPWVEDAEKELKLLEKQKAEEKREQMEISDMFPRDPSKDTQGGEE